jgi:PAS domain S-box-containing protein
MKLRLTSRIVLYFVLLATVVLAVVGVLSYRSGNESLKAAAISEMLAAAIEKEAALDTWIEERLVDIVQISSPADVAEKAANLVAAAPASEAARSAHAIVLDELEPHLVGHRGAYLELFVMEPAGGKVVASTSPAEEGKFKLGHPCFDNGKTNLYLQAPYRSADMAAPAMTVAIPLRATNGWVVAVLAARLDLAAMNTIVQRRTGLRQTEDAFLFNAEQFPVTQPRFIREPVVLRCKLDTEAVRRCAARQSGVTLAPDYRGVPSIAVYRWNAKRQLGLIVKVDQAEALAPARAFGWSVVLISGLALLATVGLAFLLASTVTRPLRALHEGVRRFAEGSMEAPLLESSGDEVGLLAQEFNWMAARVGERTAEIARVNEALKAENAERKRAELETQHQAAFACFNPNPVLELSATGEITYFNEATGDMARALGCENPEQMLPANTAAMVRECLATDKPKLRAESQISQRVISWSFFPVKFNHTVHCYAGDITECKRAEAALRASLQIIEGILNAMPVRVFWKDNNLVYLGCNATFARDAGFADPKDMIGKDDYQMGWREQAELYRSDDRQVIESGCSKMLIEEPQTTPEGSTITLLSSKIPLRGSNGEVSGVLGMYMDITERKRSEESLRLQSAALEAAANAIVITDRNGTIQSVNPAFTALTGYTALEAVGQNPRILKGGKQDEAFYRKLWQTISSGQVWTGELTNRRKDGSLYAEEMTITPLRNPDGVIIRYIAIKQDITERKRAAESLRQSEEQFRAMFDLASVGIAQSDPHTEQWLRVNKKMCEITGYSAGELLQLRVPDITYPEDRQVDQEAFERVVRGEAPDYRMEKRYIRKDGALVWVNVNMTVIRDAAGQPLRTVAAIEDITERRRAQAELENLQRQLVDASREAGMAEIATSVLHNVGNVLNSINVSTGLVVASVKKSRAPSLARVVILLQEHAQDLGAFITQDSRGKHVPAHLAQLAEHLQAEQEANVRELELLRRNVDHVKEIVALQQNYASFGGVKEMNNVVDLVEDSLRINEGALSRHEVEVVREFGSVPTLNVEKHKILQILVNLLRNAKYACHDSGRADKRLTVRVANGEGRIRISVIDNGVGIPPENLTRIFNHGFTTRKDGHGFGLHSGALAAQEMGGSLTVHSDGPGQGAAFTLELPCPARDNPHE